MLIVLDPRFPSQWEDEEVKRRGTGYTERCVEGLKRVGWVMITPWWPGLGRSSLLLLTVTEMNTEMSREEYRIT